MRATRCPAAASSPSRPPTWRSTSGSRLRAPGCTQGHTSSSPSGTRGTETVLVVEDEPAVREVTVRCLRSGGYRVLVARDGQEALEIAARELGRLHLLVTDVVMPGMDGRALAN